MPSWPSLVRVTSSGSVDSIQNNSSTNKSTRNNGGGGFGNNHGSRHGSNNCEALFNASAGGEVAVNEVDTTSNGPVNKRAKTATVAAITA